MMRNDFDLGIDFRLPRHNKSKSRESTTDKAVEGIIDVTKLGVVASFAGGLLGAFRRE